MQFSTPGELDEGRGVGRVKAMMLEGMPNFGTLGGDQVS